MEINIKIKDAEWHEVLNFMEECENKEKKPSEYYVLLKLYNIMQRATKLSRHTWYENYKTPQIEYTHQGMFNGEQIERLKEKMDDLNGIIYYKLVDLDTAIMRWMQRYYSLLRTYHQADREPMPSTFDRSSILKELNSKAKNNIFEDKYVASMGVLDAYKYLLKLQNILLKLKETQDNEEIEEMLKLVIYTKGQIKQIVDDLGCKLFIANNTEIEIAKRQEDGKSKTLYYTSKNTDLDLIK